MATKYVIECKVGESMKMVRIGTTPISIKYTTKLKDAVLYNSKEQAESSQFFIPFLFGHKAVAVEV
jgi:hypothetical protein